jgi:hypothetical protein
MPEQTQKLRTDRSINYSGKLRNENLIPILKADRYFIKKINLDGNAPKQFIKAYFYEEDSKIRKSSPNSWPSFIAKMAEKWYPHESVVEYMINRIGQELGLVMNEIKLVQANDRIRFFSKYFLNENEKLVHGAEICGEHLSDMEFAKEVAQHASSARELFTFQFIKEAIKGVFPKSSHNLLLGLVKMIAFDAITGNNDRHFYNWGIIDTKKKSNKLPRFAPIYDSARGLLWNISDNNVTKMLASYEKAGKKVVNYIEDSSPRIGIDHNCEANHFELIQFLKSDNEEYKQIILEIACEENEQRVLEMIRKEFFSLFIPERSQLLTLILKTRFKKVREI